MNELFTVVPPTEAYGVLGGACSPIDRRETIPLAAAAGRVTALPITAEETLPAFARATMDGYAVRASDTLGASETAPAYLRLAGEVAMGTVPAQSVLPGAALRIATGAMLPPGADAVIMVEDTNLHGESVEVLAGAAPGENVLAIGEDVRAGDVAIPAGRRLRPADLGGLAALGVTRIAVVARPRVAILSTGDEVVAVDAVPGAASVRDVNATTVAAIVARAGGEPVPLGIVPDDDALLEARLRDALANCDAVVLSAGSSVSARDGTARVLGRLGTILVHGIAIKPGKPTIVARCGGVPVVGLPGNPASALIVAWRLVRPLVRHLGGEIVADDGADDDTVREAILTANLPSRAGREDYVPATLHRDADGSLRATPLFGASNLIFTLVRADGLIVVPLDLGGLPAGARARVVIP